MDSKLKNTVAIFVVEKKSITWFFLKTLLDSLRGDSKFKMGDGKRPLDVRGRGERPGRYAMA